MPDEIAPQFDAAMIANGLLSLALPWLFLGFAGSSIARSRRTRIVGRELAAAQGDIRRGRLLLCMVAVALLVGFLQPERPSLPLLLFACILSAGTTLQVPQPGEGRAGEDGFAYDWEAWSWAEVRSWRLLGMHLRVDVGDRWLALRLRPGEAVSIEKLLTERIPERRSALQ